MKKKIKSQKITRKTLKLQQLVFSAGPRLSYRLRKSMYADPDQDLNKLWWDLVEKYQLLNVPKAEITRDWATKIHIATSHASLNYHLVNFLPHSFIIHKRKVLKVNASIIRVSTVKAKSVIP